MVGTLTLEEFNRLLSLPVKRKSSHQFILVGSKEMMEYYNKVLEEHIKYYYGDR